MIRNLMGTNLMGADRMLFTPDDGDGGGGVEPTHPYMAQLPDDLKTNDVIGKHDSFESFARAHLDLDGKVSSAIMKPGEGASTEAMDEFYKAVGFERIGKPEDLELKLPEAADDHMKSQADKFRTKMVELGVPKAMASGLYDYMVEASDNANKSALETEQARREEATKALHVEWGDETKTRVENAHRAFEKLTPEAVMKDIQDLGLGDETHWIKFFEKFSQLTEEDGVFLALRGTDDTRKLTADGMPALSFPSMDKK